MADSASDLRAPEEIRTPNLLIRRQPRPVRDGLSASMDAAVGPTILTLTCGVSPRGSIAVRGRPPSLHSDLWMSCDIVVTLKGGTEGQDQHRIYDTHLLIRFQIGS